MTRIFSCALIAASIFPAAAGAAELCQAQSPGELTPVIELYTSEGCSSCPPADRWLSSLKPVAAEGKAVVQAFHVGYWDYIGWVDRFAVPAHTTRQRQLAAANRLGSIYTPQLVRNGLDWRDHAAVLRQPARPSLASIRIARHAADTFEAQVVPVQGDARWSAYWTVTEHGHTSKVQAGENAGEFLQHDFVVRQYVPVGQYRGPQSLRLRTIAEHPAHPRQVNLVVVDAGSGQLLQALALSCGG